MSRVIKECYRSVSSLTGTGSNRWSDSITNTDVDLTTKLVKNKWWLHKVIEFSFSRVSSPCLLGWGKPGICDNTEGNLRGLRWLVKTIFIILPKNSWWFCSRHCQNTCNFWEPMHQSIVAQYVVSMCRRNHVTVCSSWPTQTKNPSVSTSHQYCPPTMKYCSPDDIGPYFVEMGSQERKSTVHTKHSRGCSHFALPRSHVRWIFFPLSSRKGTISKKDL